MNKYYSNTLRIISIITLIAFVCTQTALGYEGHLRLQQLRDRDGSADKARTVPQPSTGSSQDSNESASAGEANGAANGVGVTANTASDSKMAVTKLVAPEALTGTRNVPQGIIGVLKDEQHLEKSSDENSGTDIEKPAKKSVIKFLTEWKNEINLFIIKHGKAIFFLISLFCLQFVKPINSNNPLVKQIHSQNIETNLVYGWTIVFMLPFIAMELYFFAYMFNPHKTIDRFRETVIMTAITGALSQVFALYRMQASLGHNVRFISDPYWDQILKGSLINVGDPMIMGFLILFSLLFVSWAFNIQEKVSEVFYKYGYLIFLVSPIPYVITELFFSSNSWITRSQNLSPTDVWDLVAYILGGVLGTFIFKFPLVLCEWLENYFEKKYLKNKPIVDDKTKFGMVPRMGGSDSNWKPVPLVISGLPPDNSEPISTSEARGDAAGVVNMAGVATVARVAEVGVVMTATALTAREKAIEGAVKTAERIQQRQLEDSINTLALVDRYILAGPAIEPQSFEPSQKGNLRNKIVELCM